MILFDDQHNEMQTIPPRHNKALSAGQHSECYDLALQGNMLDLFSFRNMKDETFIDTMKRIKLALLSKVEEDLH